MDANMLNMKIEPIDSKYSPYKAEEIMKGIYIPLQNQVKGRAKKLMMDSNKTSGRR